MRTALDKYQLIARLALTHGTPAILAALAGGPKTLRELAAIGKAAGDQSYEYTSRLLVKLAGCDVIDASTEGKERAYTLRSPHVAAVRLGRLELHAGELTLSIPVTLKE